MSGLYDCRQAFSEALEALVESDPRIVVVTNDSVGSSNVTRLAKRFPERLINVGIAEQNMIGIGAGLASTGKIPFVCGASCFLTGRGLEQVKIDMAYSATNVKLCGVSSGVAYGPLGPTHHSLEDLAWTRVLPNLTVAVPADPVETAQAVRAAAAIEGPVFLRLSRMPVPVVHGPDYCFRFGRAAVLREGRDLTIAANGTMVARALKAAELLAGEGIEARVLNLASLQPLDQEAIRRAAAETGAILTVEEHSVYGGLGSAVAEVVVSTYPVPMRLLGVPGVFAPTGSPGWILEHFGLTPEGICRGAKELLGRKVCYEAQLRTGD